MATKDLIEQQKLREKLRTLSEAAMEDKATKHFQDLVRKYEEGGDLSRDLAEINIYRGVPQTHELVSVGEISLLKITTSIPHDPTGDREEIAVYRNGYKLRREEEVRLALWEVATKG